MSLLISLSHMLILVFLSYQSLNFFAVSLFCFKIVGSQVRHTSSTNIAYNW